MIPITTSLDFSLAHPDLVIEKLDPEDASYVSYEGKTIFHSCEEMESGYEAGFCNGGLFMLTARYYPERERSKDNYLGYTYSCKRHLRLLALRFSLNLEERSLSREYDEWSDALPSDQEQYCPVCGGETEHNWEAHVQELRA